MIKPRHSSDVFILGAGFSHAISEDMPLTDRLGAKLMKRAEAQRIPKFGGNFELQLSFLAQEHPFLSASQNLKNRALFFGVSAEIKKILEEGSRVAMKQPPQWFQTLVKFWLDNRSTVITLNYDCLVEEIVRAMIGKQEAPPFSWLDLYVAPVTPIWQRLGLGAIGSVASSRMKMRLIKLHGSLNWYFSGNAESYSEPVYATEPVHPAGGNEEESESSKRSTFGLVPFIIPPIAEKSTFFKHNLVRSQWLDAASAIWSADRVFCLGYSLPETDVTVRYWLSSAGSNRPITDFYVVNIDRGSGAHYKDLLEPSFSVQDRFVRPNAIEKFTEALISDDVPEHEDAANFLKDIERAEVGP